LIINYKNNNSSLLLIEKMINKYLHKINGIRVFSFVINFLIPTSLISHLILTNYDNQTFQKKQLNK